MADKEGNKKVIMWGAGTVAAGAGLIYLLSRGTRGSLCSKAYNGNVQRDIFLKQKQIEWKPVLPSSMKFNGHLVLSSENTIDRIPLDAENLFYEMIVELDTDTISLHICNDMLIKYLDRYTNLISKIKADGKELYVAYVTGCGTLYLDFNDYKAKELDFIDTFIRLYNPDYFVIIDEYMTMEQRTGVSATPEEWKQLVIDGVSLIKSINPAVKTVVTGHKLELDFLKSLMDIPDIDYIGINIWGIASLDETTLDGKNIKDTIDYVKSLGKKVIIEQTWLTEYSTSDIKREIATCDYMKEFDADYIQTSVYRWLLQNVDMFSPFYTGKFIYYGLNDNEMLTALNNKERTPAFYRYQTVIQEIRD